jgi:uncharacterized membrane protein YgdD (TMEM256/DUF423 family)
MIQKKYLQLSFFLMAISVGLGAIGAHAFEKILTAKQLATYQTGLKYLTYHALSLLLISSNALLFNQLKWTKRFFMIGIVFFTGNCLAYSLTGVKTFAMLIPIGGFSFILAWTFAIFEINKD